MTLVALALVVALVLVVFAFAAILARQQRAHARREDLLVNQLLHAVGKPWQPAPDAEIWRERVADARREREELELRFTPTPEQLP